MDVATRLSSGGTNSIVTVWRRRSPVHDPLICSPPVQPRHQVLHDFAGRRLRLRRKPVPA